MLFLDTVCSHFANGKAHGNLCRQFCVTGDLQPKACQTFHAGKEVVFQATLENLPVSISQCTVAGKENICQSLSLEFHMTSLLYDERLLLNQ